MTNGEKIIEVFNPEEIIFREIKGRVPTVLSFVGSGRIEVEQTWWNAEYKEPKEMHLIPIGDRPSIKYADQIVKEMDERGEAKLPDGCMGGEHFERFLNRDCEKCKHRVPTVDIVKGKSTYGCECWECKFEPKEVKE